MSDAVIDYLKSRMFKYKENHSLKQYSSIGIGAIARYFVIPQTKDEMVELLGFLHALNLRYKVIGRLTNLLVCGNLYDGVIISTENLNRKSVAECLVYAECGCSMPTLMRYAASLGLGGAEPLATIPGSVGGCVAGNAGAFGVECSDVLMQAEIYFPATVEVKTLSASEMHFSYRHSLLKECQVHILSASLALAPMPREDIAARINDIRAKRSATQPVGARSLGSVFKRVSGVGAGYYIERAGLKGYSVGDAEISREHAGFIINRGSATSDDVLALIRIAKDKVFSEFRVTLEEEIEIIS